MNRNVLAEIMKLVLLVVVRFAVQCRRIHIADTQYNPRVYKVRESGSSRHPPRMRFIPCTSLITALLLSFSVQAATQYSITLIDKIFTPIDVNDRGQVIGNGNGTANNPNGRAFLYSDGVSKDLGTLGGNSSIATGINNNGQVIGQSQLANGNWHAFVYSGGVMSDLGTLGGVESYAGGYPGGINNSGQIVGDSKLANGNSSGFLYSDGIMKDLGINSATDINDSGQIVGDLANNHAFLYSGGVISDLGTLGGAWSTVRRINNSGQIIGQSELANHDLSEFLYSGGVMKDLGYIAASDINDSGQIVGTGDIVPSHLNNLLVSNDAGWIIEGVSAISNSGQIAAVATNDGGKTSRAVLLTPVTTNPGISLKGSTLTIQLNAGDNIGKNADWWFVALSPWGHWYSYVYPNIWNDIGTDLSKVSPAYQGPLSNISSLALYDATGIPAGNYVFYFGVDMNMNGVLDYNQLFYSSLPLSFIDARYSGIYSGTFTGGDTGTFNATVSANGAITGTVYSNTDKFSYNAIGQVLSNGSMTMAVDFGAASSGAAFVGNINLTNGNASGTWTNSYWGISGSFSGTKN